jgi:hypothetical protein
MRTERFPPCSKLPVRKPRRAMAEGNSFRIAVRG